MSTRLRLSSASFSGNMASDARKSPSNPYILSSATPALVGFDKVEAAKYRKGFFSFKKKDKIMDRRNTLSGCNVLTEFLDDKNKSGKMGLGRSKDDAYLLKTLKESGLQRPGIANYLVRQDSAAEIEVKMGYVKKNGSIKYRYAFSKMSEGRKAQVVLLDENSIEILIQPKLFASELLDLVSSHFNLKEKEYFGLAFKDDTNHFQWLQLDRKVLEHEFVKRTGSLVLYFAIRFFIESIAYLRDSGTIELFYCLAKQALYRERIECGSEVVFELAALALQEAHGDYFDDETTKRHLIKLPVLPMGVLKEHPSISFCEDQVIDYYKNFIGQSRGEVIVHYMSIIESLPTYGIHYYEVKDKSGIPWWLGLSYKGISIYDSNDKKMPRRVFPWVQLENLYYRDKKFSIEVHDPKRVVHTLSSFNLYEDAILEPSEDFDELSDAISDPTTQVSVSRRTFGPGNVNVQAWFASSSQLAKSIWSMAVSQHQFYLDLKHSKSQLPVVRSLSDIVVDLCQNPTVLSNSSVTTRPVLDRLPSTASSNSLSTKNVSDELDLEAKREIYASLKARKESIEEKLNNHLKKLRELCLQEAKLTGLLPRDYPVMPGEVAPQVRRRVGTEFSLSPKIINRDGEDKDEMSHLELEYELQDKITRAAHKLMQDENNDKNIRKTKQQSYQRELQKLKTLELKIKRTKQESGKMRNRMNSAEERQYLSPIASPSVPRHHQLYGYIDSNNVPHCHMLQPHSDYRQPLHRSNIICSQIGEAGDRRLRHAVSCSAGSPSGHGPQPKSAPSSPVRQFYNRQPPLTALASPTPTRHYRVLFPSKSVRAVPQQFCNHIYSSNPNRNHNHRHLYNNNGAPVHAASCMERDRNMYNLKTLQSDFYESGDELSTPPPSGDSDERTRWMLGNDPLCTISKTYSHENDSPGNQDVFYQSHSCDEEQMSSGNCQLHWTIGAPYDVLYHGNRICSDDGPIQQYDVLPDHGVGYSTPVTSPHPLQGRNSGGKDGGNHGGRACQLHPVCLHMPERCCCEPFQHQPPYARGIPFARFQTPLFSSPNDANQSYEGVNLSQTEMTPSPEPFQSSSPKKNQGFMEVSKPFEMSDFFKYSERLRRQRHRDDISQSPLQSSSSGSLPQISRSANAMQQQQHDMSSGYSSSIGNSDQTASVEVIPQTTGLHKDARSHPLLYQPQRSDLLCSNIHTVGSDSCIDYPNRHSQTQPHDDNSSSFYPTLSIESDFYQQQLDRNRSSCEPNEVSFGSFRPGFGVAEAFGEEMLAWFAKNEQQAPSPDGPSTLV